MGPCGPREEVTQPRLARLRAGAMMESRSERKLHASIRVRVWRVFGVDATQTLECSRCSRRSGIFASAGVALLEGCSK